VLSGGGNRHVDTVPDKNKNTTRHRTLVKGGTMAVMNEGNLCPVAAAFKKKGEKGGFTRCHPSRTAKRGYPESRPGEEKKRGQEKRTGNEKPKI